MIKAIAGENLDELDSNFTGWLQSKYTIRYIFSDLFIFCTVGYVEYVKICILITNRSRS